MRGYKSKQFLTGYEILNVIYIFSTCFTVVYRKPFSRIKQLYYTVMISEINTTLNKLF